MKFLQMLLLIIMTNASAFSQNSNDFIVVGIMRADGIMVPIFEIKDNNFIDVFNSSSRSLYRLDEFTKWNFYGFNGDQFIFNVGTKVRYNPGEEYEGVGFITSYRPLVMPTYYYPMPKIGVVANEPLEMIFFEKINSDQNTDGKYKKYLKMKIGEAEKEYWLSKNKDNNMGATYNEQYDIYTPKGELPEGKYIYMQGHKMYPDCKGSFLFQCWVKKRNSNFIILSSDSYYTDCDYKEAKLINPISIITFNGQPTILVEQQLYEGEDYALLKIGDNKIISAFNK